MMRTVFRVSKDAYWFATDVESVGGSHRIFEPNDEVVFHNNNDRYPFIVSMVEFFFTGEGWPMQWVTLTLAIPVNPSANFQWVKE